MLYMVLVLLTLYHDIDKRRMQKKNLQIFFKKKCICIIDMIYFIIPILYSLQKCVNVCVCVYSHIRNTLSGVMGS